MRVWVKKRNRGRREGESRGCGAKGVHRAAFSNLPPAAAVPAAGRRGVLHVLALGDGQVIEHLVMGGARSEG